MGRESDNSASAAPFPLEADTATAHPFGALPGLYDEHDDDGRTDAMPRFRRADTEPVPNAEPARPATISRPSMPDFAELEPVVADESGDGDLVALDPYQDTTETSYRRIAPPRLPDLGEASDLDDRTSPTLVLANESDAAREVYRLFLSSDYAPALTLANELVARGDRDSMLLTIARECRVSLAAESASFAASSTEQSSSSEHVVSSRPSESAGRLAPRRLAHVGANTTLGEVAAMTGMSLDQVLDLLDRFVAMGAIQLRSMR